MARKGKLTPYKTTTLRESRQKQRNVTLRIGEGIVFIISVTSAVLSFTAFGVSSMAILITSIVVLLLLSLLANALFLFDSMSHRKGVKYIAFLTPSSGDQPFYTAMLNELLKNVSIALGQDYVIIPSIPRDSFETLSIWRLFSTLEDRQLDIDGILFIPDHPDDHFEELVGFHEDRGDIPLVLLDVYFDLANCDDRTKQRLPCFVGGDEGAGGKIAAQIASDAIRDRDIEAPQVLIVNGGEAPWEVQRAKSFRDGFLERFPNAKFIDTEPIAYSRRNSYEATSEIVAELAHDGSGEAQLDVVFACNDDMAIGARAAVRYLSENGSVRFVAPPQIVGYDGIREMREYLKGNDRWMAGTVDVRIEEQARAALVLLQGLSRSGDRRTEVQLIPPLPVRRDNLVSEAQTA